MAREPFCGNCGYSLVGLVDSSRCPECGRPLVEVLERERVARRFFRYRSPIRIFGLPLVDVALGVDDEGRLGRARGIIALGDQAVGVFALGGVAFGLFALGGLAGGGFAFGGAALGLLAVGGLAIGGVAAGGGGMGGLGIGGFGMGVIAQGGMALGWFAEGGEAIGKYVLSFRRADPQAAAVFEVVHAIFGGGPASGARWLLNVALVLGGVTLAAAALTALIIYLRYRLAPETRPADDV